MSGFLESYKWIFFCTECEIARIDLDPRCVTNSPNGPKIFIYHHTVSAGLPPDKQLVVETTENFVPRTKLITPSAPPTL